MALRTLTTQELEGGSRTLKYEVGMLVSTAQMLFRWSLAISCAEV